MRLELKSSNIKKLKVKISTFLNKTKFDIVILKFSLFQSLKVRLPFLQSDIFRTLNICSGVTNGYRGDGQALEMGRKVGWVSKLFYFLWQQFY
jgi:hypothetical protein